MSSLDIKQSILSEYRYRTELHMHTSPVSTCGDFPADEAVRKYAEAGYDAVTITNHFSYMYRFERFEAEPTAEEFVNWYMSDFKTASEAGKKYGIKVILGAEIRFSENMNDYLVYGINEDNLIEIYKRLPYGIENFRRDKGLDDILLIKAHPFRDGIEPTDPALIDGIETFNMHCGHNGRIAKAVKYAKENSFNITTAGSDFHHENGEGLAALRTKVLPEDTYALAEILRKGDYVFEIGENSVIIP